MSESEELYYLEFLKKEFNRRKDGNSLYSLRAFALNLDIDSSLLSKIMNEKLLPTLDTADKICKSLKLDHKQAKLFMTSIADEKACIELHRLNPDYTDCD